MATHIRMRAPFGHAVPSLRFAETLDELFLVHEPPATAIILS